jgi:hypothetical protein
VRGDGENLWPHRWRSSVSASPGDVRGFTTASKFAPERLRNDDTDLLIRGPIASHEARVGNAKVVPGNRSYPERPIAARRRLVHILTPKRVNGSATLGVSGDMTRRPCDCSFRACPLKPHVPPSSS